MSEKITAMIEEIKGLSVLELSELVHALEETFGVSAAAVAAPPLNGRKSASGTVSAGMPKADSSGCKNAASASIAPEARSMYTAGNSTTSAGNMSFTVISPSAAPRVSEEKMSALPNTAQIPTTARMSGTASVSSTFTLPPSA